MLGLKIGVELGGLWKRKKKKEKVSQNGNMNQIIQVTIIVADAF